MKFSDALRGAADRAPVDEVQVSTGAIAGRIKRERAVRMGANSLVGAGAVAVIAFAAVGPMGGSDGEMQMADNAVTMDAAAGMDRQSDDDRGAMEETAEGSGDLGAVNMYSHNESPWVCGSDFDSADGLWTWGDTSGVTFTVDEPQADEWEVMISNTIEAHRTVEMISFADYVITHDGMVVGHMVHPETLEYGPDTGTFLLDGQVHERMEPGTDFDSLEQWTVLSPQNCWDGQPLPAGDYDVHQAWTLAYVGESTEQGTEDGEPGDGPEFTSEMPMLLEPFRIAAGPVTLTIDGERVDDPFGDYLNGITPIEPQPLPEPLPVEPLPEGSLTPDAARELFNNHAVDGAWDMAAGSQRWVISHDSQLAQDDGQWQQNYFGCTWDDSGSPSFPFRSADLQLLDVNVNIPARIGVSYGFVVDNNPKVTSTVANASDFTLSGYWGSAQPQLFLVQNSKVVATASPQSVDTGGRLHASTTMVDGNGLFEPGASVSGDFLWRDLHGCGAQSAVSPGTYTVLAMNSLSVSNHQLGLARTLDEPSLDLTGEAFTNESLAGGGNDEAISLPAPDMKILPAPGIEALPAPDQWDAVELQGWTSLGTVTVS